VNDEHTEHVGGAAIRAWLAGALGAKVRVRFRRVRSNGRAQVIVDGEIDGTFPRDGLPELISPRAAAIGGAEYVIDGGTIPTA
jgi:hypothetical protein